MGTKVRLLGLVPAAVLVLCIAAATASAEDDVLLPVDLAILQEVVPADWIWEDYTTGWVTQQLTAVDPPATVTLYDLPADLKVPHGVSKQPGNTAATQGNEPSIWFSTVRDFEGPAAPHVVELDPQPFGDPPVARLLRYDIPPSFAPEPGMAPTPYVGVHDLFVVPNKIVWGQAIETGTTGQSDLFFIDPRTNTGRIYNTDLRNVDQMFVDQFGNVWGVESILPMPGTSRVWVFNPETGQLCRWDVSARGVLPRGVVRRRNGDVWFSFRFPANFPFPPPVGVPPTAHVGRLDPKTNVVTFYSAGQTPGLATSGLTGGFDRIETIKADPNDAMGAPNGRIWMTPGIQDLDTVEAIGVLDPGALPVPTFTRYNVPTPNPNPYGAAMGCAGSVAFTEDNNNARKLGLLVPDQSMPDGTEMSTVFTPPPITPLMSTPKPAELKIEPVEQFAKVTTAEVPGTVIDGIAEWQVDTPSASIVGDRGPHLAVLGPNEKIVASLPNQTSNQYRMVILDLPPGTRCDKVS